MTENPKEWVIYLLTAFDRQRKPIGLFFGEFVKSVSTAKWAKRGDDTIDILPLPSRSSDSGIYRDKLCVLHAPHQTIFRIVSNQNGISSAFSGEQGFAYYFETSGSLLVSGKLRMNHNGKERTLGGHHNLFMNGIASIMIRNGLVAIDCKNGELYLDQTLPLEFRGQTPAQAEYQSPQNQDLLSDQWIEEKDRLGAWLFPKTFFHDVFPSVKLRQRTAKTGTSASTQVLPPIINRWTQERDHFGTWYNRDNIFGYPLPTSSDQHIPQQMPLQVGQQIPDSGVSNRWVEEWDGSRTWYHRDNFFDHPFPKSSDETVLWQPIEESQRVRHMSDPMTSLERENAQKWVTGDELSLSDEWIKEDDEFGTWLFPNTFFDDVFPSIKLRQRAAPTGTSAPTEDTISLTSTGREPSREQQLRPTQDVGIRIPKYGENFTHILEYVIYYCIENGLIPNATLIGRIGAQAITHPGYERKRNNGRMSTILLNMNDIRLLRDAAVVRHSTDLITVSVSGHGIVKLYGETSGGLGFGSDSVLKIRGQLIISRRGREDPPISGICSITVNSGCVSIFICDNFDIILLDEGQNNYTLNIVSDGLQVPPHVDRSLSKSRSISSPIVSPILRKPFVREDTGYESAGSGITTPFQRPTTSTRYERYQRSPSPPPQRFDY